MRDQTVVIVGGSSGIGLATAQAAAAQGARIVLVSRSKEKLDAAAKSIAGDVVTAIADMVNPAAITGAIRSAGVIDHLVLTAVADEYRHMAFLAQLTDAQMERSLDKLRGFFFAARAAAPLMRERGSITMLSGASGLKPSRNFTILGAVNAAVTTMARALAIELAPVRVNAVTPGPVDTPLHDDAAREGIRKWAESEALPARYFAKPEDIANAILFLMANPNMTGQDLIIDGGLTAS
jgi:NAD(P)-dependent dehydrogenase (short-subunit alcohol dehydrogenase family)